MPNGRGFASKAQQRFMFSQHPAIAKRWAAETPSMKSLPEMVGGDAEKYRKKKKRGKP